VADLLLTDLTFSVANKKPGKRSVDDVEAEVAFPAISGVGDVNKVAL